MKYRDQMFAYRGSHDDRYRRIKADRAAVVAVERAKLLEAGCKPVVDFPAYLVSPRGDVYSTNCTRLIKVRPGTKPGGCKFVGLSNPHGTKYRMVHRLVATAFIPNPLNLPEVNHIDGNKAANSRENLEWVTRKQNSNHASRTGLIKRGFASKRAKLTKEQAIQIRQADGTYREVGRMFGVSAQTVCNIKRGLRTFALMSDLGPAIVRDRGQRRGTPGKSA